MGQCDKNVGTEPYKGANATIEQAKPLVDYIAAFVENQMTKLIQYASGQIKTLEETDVPKINIDNQQDNKNTEPNVPNSVPNNFSDKRQQIIVDFMKMNNKITLSEIANILKVNNKTIKRDIEKLKEEGIIERVGENRSGLRKSAPRKNG
ncbi:hypothetical protein FACS189413_07150 [Bacteroidia bacterium]|nr:hypothetical protein FACS189413_07150 [Bacteroidia bacterium]